MVILLLFPWDRKTLKTRFIQIAVVAARVGRQGCWQLPIGQSGDAVELGAGMTPLSICIPTPEQLGKSCDGVEGIGAEAGNQGGGSQPSSQAQGSQQTDRRCHRPCLLLLLFVPVLSFMHLFLDLCIESSIVPATTLCLPSSLASVTSLLHPHFLQGRPMANPQQSLS